MSILEACGSKAILRASNLFLLQKPMAKMFSAISLPIMLLAAPACAQESIGTDDQSAPASQQDLAQEDLAQEDIRQDNASPAPQFDPDAPELPIVEPSEAALASLDMIDKALKEIDDSIERDGNGWQFQLEDTQVIVISDPIAERMRIMVPIIQADSLNQDLLARVMQANFDSALDARYAIANGLLWGTYIHPLTGLGKQEFLSGLGQTISIVQTFGTSFSSGTVVFGGGDSQAIVEEQIEEQEREREEASFT